jgi:hypothetical protein
MNSAMDVIAKVQAAVDRLRVMAGLSCELVVTKFEDEKGGSATAISGGTS